MAGYLGIEASDEKPYIFISYNTEDQGKLCNIMQILQKRPINIWYDNGIQKVTDEEWQEQIAMHIRDSEIVFFFISHGIFMKKDSFVRKEYDVAKKHKKNICVVLLDEIDARSILPKYDFWWNEVDLKQCIEAMKMSDNLTAEAMYAECCKIGAVKAAKYDIAYVDNPADGSMDDEDFEIIMENDDPAAKGICPEKAKQIEKIQKEILALSVKEQPYDIFICYKETDENSYRTLDSAIANDIYYRLSAEGFKVFYAAVSLAGKHISEYESYIFYALKTSKVMLSLGTRPEYFNYVWVKNEWSRFLKITEKDRSRRLFPCYRDMNPDELPEEFADIQAQDMSRTGFLVDIVREIRKVIVKDAPQTSLEATAAMRADAYLGKLMAELHVKKRSDLASCGKWYTNNSNYQKALRFADAGLKDELEKYAVSNAAYLPSTPNGAFEFSVKDNGYLVESLRDERYTVIKIPEQYKGKPVTTIGDSAFSGCENLRSVVIPDSVTSIGDEAFSDCRYLTSVTIPGSVTAIGDSAFSGCEDLTSVVIPDSVISIGDEAFGWCASLTSVTIPDSVTSIGDGAFSWCENLRNVTIPDSVTTIGFEAFYGCESLTSVVMPDSVTSIEDYAFSGCKKLKSVRIPNSVTFIEDGVFTDCTSLTSVTIPDSVTSIGKQSFYGCISLISVRIPDSVDFIEDEAFYGCGSLTNIIIPDNVFTIGQSAFEGCERLTSVTIPKSVTFIGSKAFKGCKGLADENGFVIIRNILHSYCHSGEHVTIPSSVTTIGAEAFKGCESLASVIIPSSVTSIEIWAFNGCTSLRRVTIPDSVSTIGYGAFNRCMSLTSVTIPDSVTTIGGSAFSGCENLTSVTIPDSVTIIGGTVFQGCERLRIITCHGDYDTLKAAFSKNNADDKNIFVCIEHGMIEEQKRREEKEKLLLLEYRHKQGLCSYCGGAFKRGLFSTKCINCGRKKDY